MKISISDLQKSDLIIFKDQPWRVVSLFHNKLGRGRGLVKMQLKNLKTSTNLTQVFRSDETFDKIEVENINLIYLYQKGEKFYFMNQENYQEMAVDKDKIDAPAYLLEGFNVKAKVFENEIILVELPEKITVEVAKTVPGVKGNSKESGDKAAFLSNGTQILVPLFIKENEKIIIDKSGKYIGRV